MPFGFPDSGSRFCDFWGVGVITLSERRELSDGLVLRRAIPADAESIAELQARAQSDPGWDTPDEGVRAWVFDLLTRPHPTFHPEDFVVVEDSHTGAIVSSMCLISQTWRYGDVPFNFGRPELVATHPDYRRRGLVRAQFELLHALSAERGELVQGITGIPWYYRQFGYEMTVELFGARMGYAPHVRALKEGEAEPYHLRPAIEADIPFLMATEAHAATRSLLGCVRDAALWRYELAGRSSENCEHRAWRIIQTPEGEPVGYLAHPVPLWGNAIFVTAYELQSGVSWLAVTPVIVRYLWAYGAQAKPSFASQKAVCESFAFALGGAHPAYEAFVAGLPRVQPPYAWYMRVPDLPAFLRHITPVLEARLALSIAAGHSGELTIGFYRRGLRFVFERGRITEIAPWEPQVRDTGAAEFPGLTFLQLLFGHRSLAELRYAFPDCGAGPEATVLLNALFPKQASCIWHLS